MSVSKKISSLLIFVTVLTPVFFNRTILNAFFVPQTTFFVLVVTLGFLLTLMYYRELVAVEWRIVSLILAPVLIFLISGIAARNAGEYFYFMSKWTAYFVWVWLGITYFSRGRISFHRKFWYLVGVILFLPVLYGILQYYGIDFHWELKSDYPLISTFGNPNAFVQVVVLVLPLHILLGAHRRDYLRWIFWGMALADAFSLVLSGSRAGILIVGVDAFLAVLYFAPKKYKVWTALVLGVFALIVGGSRIKSLHPDAVRLLIYRSSLNMARENPIIGVGAGNYKIVYQLYRSKEEHYKLSGESTKVAKAHNFFIETLSEAGPLGLAAVVLLLIGLWRLNRDFWLRVVWLNFVLDAMVSFNYLNVSAMFVFFSLMFLWSVPGSVPNLVSTKGGGKLKSADKAFKRRVYAVVLVSVSVWLLFLAFFQVRYYVAENLYTQASRHEHYKRYRAALFGFRDTGRYNPYYFDAWKKAAFLAWSKFGDYSLAIVYFRKFLESVPMEFSVLHDVGFSYDHLKKKDYAIYFYRKCLELDPYYPVAVGNLANAYYDRGNYEMAKIMYLRIIKLGLHTIAAYNNLGNTYQALGKLQEAREMYLRVLQINPRVFETLYNLSYIEYRLGLYQDAYKHILRAKQVRPENKIVDRLLKRIKQSLAMKTE